MLSSTMFKKNNEVKNKNVGRKIKRKTDYKNEQCAQHL